MDVAALLTTVTLLRFKTSYKASGGLSSEGVVECPYTRPWLITTHPLFSPLGKFPCSLVSVHPHCVEIRRDRVEVSYALEALS